VPHPHREGGREVVCGAAVALRYQPVNIERTAEGP
jgi:hypothetical protein